MLYSAAVVAIPVSVACKYILGITGTTWIDPTLILAVAALLALMPRWGDFLTGELRLVVSGTALLSAVSLVCALSGLLLRPPSSVYTVLREPLRLWLNLCWFLLSCWFLMYKPRVVLVGSIIAVAFGLSAGIYLHLAGFGLAPAPALVVTYTRAYLLRQTLWVDGIPLPRMGGLFFEAPPFGLFMFSMLVVLCCTRAMQRYRKWTAYGLVFAVIGILSSLADQVLLAGAVGLFTWLPKISGKRYTWPLVLIVMFAIGAFELQSIAVKQTSSNNGIVTRINGASVGERNFHLRYGLLLLQAHPAATLFGIGPGRYGEYASETGDFPDTVNMQTSEAELLVEWGVAGLAVWIGLLACVAARVWKMRGLAGLGLLLGLVLADSFQANWKYEGVFLGVAALCMRSSAL